MKYVIVDNGLNEVPFLFPDTIDHSEIKKIFPNVVSAGFVSIGTLKSEITITPYGQSTTLQLKSRPEDAKIIKKLFKSEWD